MKVPVWKKQIGFALYHESLLPIRIVMGYHGFASENSFREAFMKFLEGQIGYKGFGPTNFPNLMICGSYSLIKLNFMPYGIRVSDRQSIYKWFSLFDIDTIDLPISGENMWPLYASYPENPILLLLELIWTRLEYSQNIQISEYDLGMEIVRPLLLAKAIEKDNEIGWHYEYVPFFDKQLTRLPTLLNWKPFELNDDQSLLILYLIDTENSGLTGLEIKDPELLKLFGSNKDRLDEAIESITQIGLVILEDTRLKLTTRHLKVAVLPSRKIFAGDDNEGMFTRWINMRNFT